MSDATGDHARRVARQTLTAVELVMGAWRSGAYGDDTGAALDAVRAKVGNKVARDDKGEAAMPNYLVTAVQAVIQASHGSGDDGRVVVPVPAWTALRRALTQTLTPRSGDEKGGA